MTLATTVDAEQLFQVMPALTAEEMAVLEADIAERGVLVPALLDQHGRILDGHHRREIAARLGIDCPTEVRHVADDDDARQVALTLNLTRRHLTREQRRGLIAAEITARPGDSDRAIARRLGCAPTTVGTVRRQVSNLDTTAVPAPVEDLGTLEARARKSLAAVDTMLAELVAGGADPLLAVGILMDGLKGFERHCDEEEFLGPIRRHIVEPRIRALLGTDASGNDSSRPLQETAAANPGRSMPAGPDCGRTAVTLTEASGVGGAPC